MLSNNWLELTSGELSAIKRRTGAATIIVDRLSRHM